MEIINIILPKWELFQAPFQSHQTQITFKCVLIFNSLYMLSGKQETYNSDQLLSRLLTTFSLGCWHVTWFLKGFQWFSSFQWGYWRSYEHVFAHMDCNIRIQLHSEKLDKLMFKSSSHGISQTWIRISILPLHSCVTFGEFNLCKINFLSGK